MSCSVNECTRISRARNFCTYHYELDRRVRAPSCTIDDCASPVKAKGLCSSHYQKRSREASIRSKCPVDGCIRFQETLSNPLCAMHKKRLRMHGDVGTTVRAIRGSSLQERFDFYVTRSEGCWGWRGYISSEGYGTIAGVGLAHRVSYALSAGLSLEELRGLHVHHKCANKSCVNPEHLEQATSRENSAEMFARTDYVDAIETAIGAIENYNPEDPVLKYLKLVIRK